MSFNITISASEQPDPQQQGQPMSHSSGFPSMQPFIQTVPVPVYIGGHGGWNPQYGRGQSAGPNRGPPFKGGQRPGTYDINVQSNCQIDNDSTIKKFKQCKRLTRYINSVIDT